MIGGDLTLHNGYTTLRAPRLQTSQFEHGRNTSISDKIVSSVVMALFPRRTPSFKAFKIYQH